MLYRGSSQQSFGNANYLQAEFPGVEGFSPPKLPVYACLARSTDPRNPRMQVLPNGDLIASAVPVITLLSYAYDVPINPSPRLSPLPDWILREKYIWKRKRPPTPSLPVFRTAKYEAEFSK